MSNQVLLGDQMNPKSLPCAGRAALLLSLLLTTVAWQSPPDESRRPAAATPASAGEAGSAGDDAGVDGVYLPEALAPYPVGSFVRAIDGDTILVKVGGKTEKVRLLGVRSAGLEKPEGRDCRDAVENLLREEQVWLRPGKPTGGVPRGTREAFVHRCPDGLFVNLELVRQGWADVTPAKCEDHDTFVYYARRAELGERGKWAARKQAPPGAAASDRNADPGNTAGPPATPPPIAPVADISAGATEATPTGTVFVTASGKKYHKQGCRHLRANAKPIALDEAGRKGYSPCSVCKP